MAFHLSDAGEIVLIGDFNQLPYIDIENLFEITTGPIIKHQPGATANAQEPTRCCICPATPTAGRV